MKKKKYLKYYHRVENFKKRFKNFPHLYFHEFLELENYAYSFNFNDDFNDKNALGTATQSFIKFFTKKPEKIAKNFFKGKQRATEIKNEYFSNIQLLYTHSLNKGLYEFLKQMDFPEEKIRFIINKDKVLPLGKGREKEQK